ncbi:HD domain-containing protein [Rudanella paleaurantiibacter]|uniref:HD domain-containing protein n=1 Tax=Rudanella paleaurantiibacter TaxID=2614655 RepID=A0A7J5TUF3_9BACT|nr:HD domain-containing protein [Rudanella paleaurantiibacter]KAB7727634.1 HD domain-containing protein [Rudanella paleaurantiibacter]
MDDAHSTILKAAETYMRVRQNDVHIPISYGYAMRLAHSYPEADRDIVAAAIILHDIGWYSIDEDDIFKKGFQTENYLYSDVRYLHESEGVRLSAPLLTELGYSADFIQRVGTIIDGHDTRREAHSLEDKIVRDADKLWRFTVTGVSIASTWFKLVPSGYCRRLVTEVIPYLHLPESVAMAEADLADTRATLCCDVI